MKTETMHYILDDVFKTVFFKLRHKQTLHITIGALLEHFLDTLKEVLRYDCGELIQKRKFCFNWVDVVLIS